MTSGNYPIPVGTGGASLGVDGKAYSSGGSVHGSHSSGSGGGSMHGAPPTSGNRYYAGSVHSANYAPSTYKSQQTAVPLQTKGFYIPGAIETEDYSPLRKLHWILFALYLIQAIIMLPIAASIARGSIPMATAFSTFDPFRRIYINQIQVKLNTLLFFFLSLRKIFIQSRTEATINLVVKYVLSSLWMRSCISSTPSSISS